MRQQKVDHWRSESDYRFVSLDRIGADVYRTQNTRIYWQESFCGQQAQGGVFEFRIGGVFVYLLQFVKERGVAILCGNSKRCLAERRIDRALIVKELIGDLARLLQVGALGRAIESDLTLLAAALRTNAPVYRRAEALCSLLDGPPGGWRVRPGRPTRRVSRVTPR